MAQIKCTQCGKMVETKEPASYDDNSTFVCRECCLAQNASLIEKEKKINAKLAEYFAQGKPYVLADVVKEVEAQ